MVTTTTTRVAGSVTPQNAVQIEVAAYWRQASFTALYFRTHFFHARRAVAQGTITNRVSGAPAGTTTDRI